MKAQANILIVAWLISLYGTAARIWPNWYYTRPAEVIRIEEVEEPHEPDHITIRTIDGYEHTINGWAGGWNVGERYTILFDKNGTADRSDDILVDFRSR